MGGRFMQLVITTSLLLLTSCNLFTSGDGPKKHDLLVAGTGSGTGAISSSSGDVACSYSGTTASGTCRAGFVSGTNVTVTATPADGHTFVGWSGACTGTSTCQVTMSQAQAVTAAFAPLHPLTLTGSGVGSGSVTSSPRGIICSINGGTASGTCNASYASGAVVTLTAAPGSGHAFTGWSGACTGISTCQVTMSQAQSVTAAFAPLRQLTVTGSGAGSGSVTSSPGRISCSINGGTASGTCTSPYPSVSVVTLTATPASGHAFTGWSGACTGTGTCQVTMSQARTVTAAFTPTRQLTVAGSGAGSGSVTSSPGGITCSINGGTASGTCTAPYASGAVVTLTAAPASGHTFAGWSGACTGTGTCQVTMSQARSVTAAFTSLSQLTLTGGGAGSGSVTSSPGGIICSINGGTASGTCSAPYTSGAVVTLTAAPASGHAFTGWSGACTGTGTCQVTMSQARSVTAAFAPLRQLTVTGSGAGSGSVTSSPGRISCSINAGTASGTCTSPYPSVSVVTLTAAPASGHAFTGWSGACTGTGNCQVSMSQARTVTAAFAPLRQLTVTGSGTGRGSVTSSPSGINCTISGGASGTCNARYPNGAVVTLTAAPISTHTFAGWSGACTGTGSCRVTMSQAQSVTAVFRIGQQLAVPAYFDVPSGEWSRLLQKVPPSNVVIINPNNGPGGGYASRINDARSRGARVLGYVYTKYANTRLDSLRNRNGAYDRMIDSVKADIDAYYHLYPNLDGIFLDEVTTECSYAQSYYKPIYDYIRSRYRNATVIINPGTAVESCYLEAADIIVTFESSFANYQNNWSTENRGWETNARSARIWHIVHTASLSQLNTALELSRRRNAGYVYVTDLTAAQNTYGVLPSYFQAEADNVTAYGTSSP